MISRKQHLLILALGLTAITTSQTQAQEPINAADSATQPSPGHVILKEQFRYYRLDVDSGPEDRRGEIDEYVFSTIVNVGLSADVSLSLRMPVRIRDREFDLFGDSEREEGIGDLTALAKWRILRKDSGPLDTMRLSLIGGAEIRTGDSPFTSDAYNPVFGLALTQITGRHGLNAALHWTFTTNGNDEPILPGESTADLLRYDLAYLWRLSPREYSEDTHGAWYLVAELNGLYETNGDNELFVSPGIMYEAKTWTAELSVQIPAWQEIDHRAETQFAVVAGLRFSW